LHITLTQLKSKPLKKTCPKQLLHQENQDIHMNNNQKEIAHRNINLSVFGRAKGLFYLISLMGSFSLGFVPFGAALVPQKKVPGTFPVFFTMYFQPEG